MQLRDHEGVKGKRDAYPFDPRLLKVEAGYNVRVMDSPEMRAKNAELKESIRVNGVKVPLEVKFDGEDVYVVAGHRRHAMVSELIAEGEPIETVLVIAEPKGTNDAERALNLVISNSGEPLKPLEVAEVVRRLTAFGWDKGQIAKRMGWKSTSTVGQHLDMLAMPADLQKAVTQGKVSATMARRLEKEQPGLAAKIVSDAEDEQKRLGKKGRATPKAIRKIAPKKTNAKPKTHVVLSDELHEAPAAEPEQIAAPEPPTTSALAATPENGFHNLGEALQVAVPQGFRESIKQLLDTIEPFANLAHDFDFDAHADDDVVEVPFKYLKKAWTVFAKMAGAEA